MTKLLLLSLLIIAISVAFLLVKVLLLRAGEFPSMHIHDSAAMRQRGVKCVIDQDIDMRNKCDAAVKEREFRNKKIKPFI